MELWRDFLTHQGEAVHKWTHYFPAYERHFAPWRDRAMTFFEVGINQGGSLAMWRGYFGPSAVIVGIDIDPRCKAYQKSGFEIRIGDQSDPAFLDSLVAEFGAPDVVLDDGSHRSDHMLATFEHLYPLMPKNAVYLVEDTHNSYWPEYGGGVDEPRAFMNVAKGLVDRLNAEHSRGAVPVDDFARETSSIAFYDGIAVFEKATIRKEAAQVSSKTAPTYFPTLTPKGPSPEHLFKSSLKARLGWLFGRGLNLHG